MILTELDPVLPIRTEGKGDGCASAGLSRGQDQDLIWVAVLKDTGEICCAPNPQVRIPSKWITARKRPDVDSGTVVLN